MEDLGPEPFQSGEPLWMEQEEMWQDELGSFLLKKKENCRQGGPSVP